MKYTRKPIHGYIRLQECAEEMSMLNLSSLLDLSLLMMALAKKLLHGLQQTLEAKKHSTLTPMGAISLKGFAACSVTCYNVGRRMHDQQGKISPSLVVRSHYVSYTILQIRDYRKDWQVEVNQPIAGNYYPLNLGMFIKDDKEELSVLVDRAVGGSSIVDGHVEIMLHRRLIHDDDRGVAEALNETVCVLNKCTGLPIIGKYYLRINPLGEGAKWHWSFGQEINSCFLLAFIEQDENSWKNSHVVSFSGIDPSYVVPDNVAIITLQELDDGKGLLRLAHLYEVGEDKGLAAIASVELKKLFATKKIKEIKETSLSANQGRAEMEKKRLVWKVEGSFKDDPKVVRGGPVDPATLVVELAPMEIRTFVLAFN